MRDAILDVAEDAVAMAGIEGPLRLADVLYIGGKANRIAPLQVLRADRIAGPDHVVSAARHAQRAFAEGRNQADRLEVEFTRYVAGERQIRAALAKLGVADGTPRAVVVALGPKRLDALAYYLHAAGAKTWPLEAPTGPAAEAAALAFGITKTQLAASTAGRGADLVLEAVAAVDLMR